MDAPRTTRRAVAEWVAAAVILVGLLALVSTVLREARAVSPVTPLSAREVAAPTPTASVPEGAVSVPLLILPGGVEIRVGDADKEVRPHLGGAVEVSPVAIERGGRGERQTRIFETGGVRFALVIEPFEQETEPRVAAIYVK
jgi:hypothetical protein